MQAELAKGLDTIALEELATQFGSHLTPSELTALTSKVVSAVHANIETTSTMDAAPRFVTAAAASTIPLVDFFSSSPSPPTAFAGIMSFRTQFAARSTALVEKLRTEYLTGLRGPAPASPYLNKTKGVYEYIRLGLGIKMHGEVNLNAFAPGMEEQSIGQNVSLIHEVSPLPFHLLDSFPMLFFVGYSGWQDARHCCCSFLLTFRLIFCHYTLLSRFIVIFIAPRCVLLQILLISTYIIVECYFSMLEHGFYIVL